MFKDEKIGHCPWDLNCPCELCANDRFNTCIDGINHSASKPGKMKNKKSTQSEFYKRWMEGDPNIGPLGEDNEGVHIFFLKFLERTKPSTYEVFLKIKKQEAEKKKKKKAVEEIKVAEKEEAYQEEVKLGKRPIIDKSPPPK
ncbi:hypothetical protein J1N35_001611 [Gossypium stocksii]|uniref:Uncharacterized protein n=1 Tax=Gossypium stocksii TaxID=47602 RepID=A0A9D4AMB6_9ROSI|nr:hypothetical protein J1N35_001611 [Gossypium stocksii]